MKIPRIVRIAEIQRIKDKQPENTAPNNLSSGSETETPDTPNNERINPPDWGVLDLPDDIRQVLPIEEQPINKDDEKNQES